MAPAAATPESRPDAADLDRVSEAVLQASRVLVGVATRSVSAVDPDVTLPQYRALAVLRADGPQNLGALAESLGIHSSSATRLCDRLVARGLVERHAGTVDRRAINLVLTRRGQRIVERVMEWRRAEIRRIVGRIPAKQRGSLVDALAHFNAAVGATGDGDDEAREQAWTHGWSTD